MADSGGGRYHYIADARSIAAVFAGELGELLQLALRDLTISLRAPHTWRVSLLNDLPIEREGDWLNAATRRTVVARGQGATVAVRVARGAARRG